MSQYRVSGGHPVLGHEPGAVFSAVLDKQQESRLLERGSITRVLKDASTTGTTPKSKKE
jgi:hypothetical protein